MATAIVILAGGEGRRIGGDKPVRRLGAQSLIERALEFALRLSPVVALAVREPDQLRDAPVQRLLDMPGIGGPLAGLGAALQFGAQLEFSTVLTLPCDAPFLPEDLLSRLGDALAIDKLASVPASGGQQHPACALWRVEALDRLPAYLQTGRAALSGFASHVGSVEVEWPVETFDPFFNINNEDDLARAEALLASV